jgi:hypothetical protein
MDVSFEIDTVIGDINAISADRMDQLIGVSG